MASSRFYFITYYTYDADTSSWVLAISKGVTTQATAEYSIHAGPESTPQEGDMVLASTIFPVSNEYDVLAEGTAPNKTPTDSRHFMCCLKTYDGVTSVCNFNEACGAPWIAKFHQWLAFWNPAMNAQIAGTITGTSTRLEIVNALAALIQPGVPAIVEA